MRQLDLFGNIIENKEEKKTPEKIDLKPGEEVHTEVSNIVDEPGDDNSFDLLTVQNLDSTNADSVEVISESIEDLSPIDEEIIPAVEPVIIEEATIQEPVEKFLVEQSLMNADQRSVVFDDGKISVKLKSKTTVASVNPTEKKEAPKPDLKKRGRKSFKDIDAEADLIEIPDDEVLYQKQYYSISHVADWFKVNASLIRFWENEFDIIKPKKNRKGDRLFRPEDVKNLQLIYHLLREKKYTIEGAKEYLKTNRKKADTQLQLVTTLQKFKSFLLELKANL